MLFRRLAKIARVLRTSTSLDERALGLGKLYKLADELGQNLVTDAIAELGAQHPAVLKLLHLVTASETVDGKKFTPAGHGARWALGASTVVTGENDNYRLEVLAEMFEPADNDDDAFRTVPPSLALGMEDEDLLVVKKVELEAVSKLADEGKKELETMRAEIAELKAAAAAASVPPPDASEAKTPPSGSRKTTAKNLKKGSGSKG